MADWGLAKIIGEPDDDTRRVTINARADPSETQEGQVIGTPAYMAPEMAAGKTDAIDFRSDIYVLGATLFNIRTNQHPHRRDTPLETIQAIIKEKTPHANKVDPSVPAALDAICARAMAHDSEDRYASVAELVADVEAWLDGSAIRAYPENPVRRLVRSMWNSGRRR